MTLTAADAPRRAIALRCAGLIKRYADVVAVVGLHLEVRTGECFGLLGPNGAGKTTTIEICEGLTESDRGVVEVLGRRWESDARDLRERLGIQLQDTQLEDKLTVRENRATLPQLLSARTRGGRGDRAGAAGGKARRPRWKAVRWTKAA